MEPNITHTRNPLILWRLTQDAIGIIEGSCISESKYKGLYYTDRYLFEPITEVDIKEYITYVHKQYCDENGLECLFFYSDKELNNALNKIENVRMGNY